MIKSRPSLALAALTVAGAASASPSSRGAPSGPFAPQTLPFTVSATDGVSIVGQVDLPATSSTAAVVILVPGSGAHDRDMLYGRSGTARDKAFKDLAERFTARGLAAVRFDKRGVRFGVEGAERYDKSALVTNTTSAQRDDVRVLYDWARSPKGLGARCVVFFAHSEGMAHLGRLAASGAPAPDGVVGMGALMESPQSVLRWQMAERTAYSIEAMDADHDGVTTNDEVRANWMNTPAGTDKVEDVLNPDGAWTTEAVAKLKARDLAAYETEKDKALAAEDAAPFPDANRPAGPYQWWKSWFTDSTPVAVNLARWRTRFQLHYGGIDSQTNAARQAAAAFSALGADLVTITLHPGLGHGLGRHPAIGPIEAAIADQIADEAAAACAPKA